MHKVMNWRGFLLILGVMLCLFGFFFLMLQGNLHQKREEENNLWMELTLLEEENRSLKAQQEMMGTEDYIVTSAMNEYAYMNKNDIRFEYSNPDALYAYSTRELDIMMEEGSE